MHFQRNGDTLIGYQIFGVYAVAVMQAAAGGEQTTQ